MQPKQHSARFQTLTILCASIALLVITAPVAIAADDTFKIVNPLGDKTTFSDIITRITGFANDILAPLATIMVLVAGFLYMTAGGDPEKLRKAHKTLIWALVGIAIVILSNGAETVIKSVLGTK